MSDFPISYYFFFLLSQLFPSRVLTSGPLESQSLGHPSGKHTQGSWLASGAPLDPQGQASPLTCPDETPIPLCLNGGLWKCRYLRWWAWLGQMKMWASTCLAEPDFWTRYSPSHLQLPCALLRCPCSCQHLNFVPGSYYGKLLPSFW